MPRTVQDPAGRCVRPLDARNFGHPRCTRSPPPRRPIATSRSRAPTLLALTFLANLFVVELAPPLWLSQTVNIAASIFIGAQLAQMTRASRDLWVVAILGVAPALLDLAVPWASAPLELNLLKELFWTAFPAYVAVRLVAWLLTAADVTRAEVVAAATVYLLAGSFFADVYQIQELLLPGSLAWGDNFGSARVFADYLYFSFITMASVGYGDVTPARSLTRLTVVVQAVFGLMYMAVLVARFVSQWTTDTILEEQEEALEPTHGPLDDDDRSGVEL